MVIPQTEIIICKGGAEVARRVVEPGEYLIGRGEDCALRVESEKVSRQHARLIVSFQDWSIADLGSANGTQLNDEPVGEAAVKVWPSQIIRVGDATIELRQVAASDPDASLMPTQAAVRRHLPQELQGQRRYHVGRQIAQGGMGAILSAADQGIRREVAMKVMLNTMDPGDVLRFIEEAQVTGQLEHPNIVPVHELSVNEQGEVFYTMKMVKGVTLKKVLELLTKGVAATVAKYPLPVLLTMFQKVCDAIAFAHSKGVIHRDLKPENIMLGDYGEVLVMDWGLARLVGSAERAAVVRTAKADEGDAMRTQTGSIMGTPAYMSPEQARGEIERLDARSDIYALGTILYELLTLRPAVAGKNTSEVLAKVARGDFPAVPTGGYPDSLVAVIHHAMALDRNQRYASVAELQTDIAAFQGGFATRAERAGLARQIFLAIMRNKAASIGLAAVLLVGTTLGTKAVIEGRRAEATLGRLRGTAPTFIAQARALIAEEKFDDALQKLAFALDLAPGDATAHLLRGHILQTQLRFADAAASFERVLRLGADAGAVADARTNLALCERLRAASGGGPVKKELLRELHAALLAQRRTGEAAAVARRGLGREEMLRGYEEKVVAAYGEVYRGSVQWCPDDTLTVTIMGRERTHPITDLRTFAGMPFSELMLDFHPVSDLTPLAGMRLTLLRLGRTKIRDLSPLRGMPLRRLEVSETEISDLSPLAGMPLEHLDLAGCQKVRDLSPLKGMPMRVLLLAALKVPDMSPIRGMPLEDLDAMGLLTDLRILEGMPLKRLRTGFSALRDLSPLAGLPLEDLDIGVSEVRDLTPLRGLRLKQLSLHKVAAPDLQPLRGMPLEYLRMDESVVTDLSPLLDCPALKQIILPPKAGNVGILRQLPHLERLSFRNEGDYPAQTAAEFWAEYDAKAK